MRALASARGLALTAVTVAAIVAFLLLGQWQWERSRPVSVVADLPVVPALDVVPDRGRVLTRDQGRLVTVTGTWRPDRTVLVADRSRPDGTGEAGRWVVTAVEVRPGSGGGPAVLLPVVRGWQAAAPGAGAGEVPAPEGPASVTGWVQASEPLDNPAAVLQPDGVVGVLAASDLVNRWPERVLDAFVIVDAGAGGGGVLVGTDAAMPGPVQFARADRDWRNVAYAAQWLVFAAFAVVLWWRALRDVALAQRPGAPGRPQVTEVPG